MADEQVDWQAEAKKIGWIPKEEFKGDPKNWVDAQDFVESTRNYIPFIKHQNRDLTGKLEAATGKVQTLEQQLKAMKEQIDTLAEYNSEANKEKLKEMRTQLIAELKDAKKEGDVDKEIRVTEKLTEATSALREADREPAKPNGSTTTQIQMPPEFAAWKAENPWYEGDEVVQAGMTMIAKQMAASGQLEGLTPRERFDKIGEATKKKFKLDVVPNRVNKVEGSHGGAGDRQTGSRGYSDLPADVKAACDRFGNRLVGKDKKFPTIEAWRAKYAQDYFSEA
jgi:hypothetical protein